MKTYFVRRDQVWVYVDCPIVGEYGERELNVKQVRDAVKALEMLGKKVVKMTLANHCFLDMSAPYYGRFPEEVVDRAYRRLTGLWDTTEIKLKGNRLYVTESGYDICLPKDIRGLSDKDNRATVSLHFEEGDRT